MILGLSTQYATYAVGTDPGALPGGVWAAWVISWAWGAVIGPMVTFLFLLFPDGHVPSRRWRPVAWAAGVDLVIIAVAGMVNPNADSGLPVGNPVGIEAAGNGVDALIGVAFPILVASAFLSFASLIVRFRRAGDEERQQIRWLAVVGVVAAIAFALGLVAGIISDQTHSRALELFGSVMLVIVVAAVALGIPITAGVAILRYRLYELDIVVKKTVVFAIVASTLTVLYLAVLALATLGNVSRSGRGGRAPRRDLQPGPPERRGDRRPGRVRQACDPLRGPDVVLRPRRRNVLRERCPASHGPGARGRGRRRACDRLAPGRRGAPPGGELAYRCESSAETDAGDELPTIDEGGHAAEVRDQGELLGALSLVMPANEPMNSAKEALVQDLASQAGLVLRNARLIEELRASRQRIVAAQDARAKQLERNIHDGAQQQLVALAVKLRLAEGMAAREPDEDQGDAQ